MRRTSPHGPYPPLPLRAIIVLMKTYPLIERRSMPRPALRLEFNMSKQAQPAYIKSNVNTYQEQPIRLFAIPSLFGEEFEADEYPIPTSSVELPELHKFVTSYIVSLMEIWAGRRNPEQLIARTHRTLFHYILKDSGSKVEVLKIKHLYLQEPLDGICEAVATIRDGERLRSLALKFEGLDGRWLCTALEVL